MMPPYDLLIPGKLGANMTKREGGWPGIDSNIFLKSSVMLYRPPPRMMLQYNLLIPGKLGCNVTKREGGGLALIQIFF